MFHLVYGVVLLFSQNERKQKSNGRKVRYSLFIQIPNAECWLRVRGIFRYAADITFFMSSQFDCHSRSIIRNSTESRAKERSFVLANDWLNTIKMTLNYIYRNRATYTNLFYIFFFVYCVSLSQKWQLVVRSKCWTLNAATFNISKYIQILSFPSFAINGATYSMVFDKTESALYIVYTFIQIIVFESGFFHCSCETAIDDIIKDRPS